MLPSHIKPITRSIFSKCHKFNNSRINSNQPCNQSKHFMIVINFDIKHPAIKKTNIEFRN
jgi:hypothetical protein